MPGTAFLGLVIGRDDFLGLGYSNIFVLGLEPKATSTLSRATAWYGGDRADLPAGYVVAIRHQRARVEAADAADTDAVDAHILHVLGGQVRARPRPLAKY